MEELTRFLKKKGFTLIEPLKGDASTRSFYRVRKKRETFVLMKFNDEGIEEQIKVYRLLGAILPLARIVEVFYPINSLLMEDAGDQSLENFVREGGNWRPIYERLLEIIEDLQKYTPALLKMSHPVATRKLNKKRFKRELEFTYTNFILPYEISIEKEKWNQAVEKLLNLIEYKYVVTHRDFHSRNIFIKNGKIIILDYQDTMLAPVPYDYASLLRDNYVLLPERERKKLEEIAIKKTSPFQYEVISLQRHLKALGTFGYQIHRKGNKYFADYIPITREYLKGEIKKLSFIEFLPLVQE